MKIIGITGGIGSGKTAVLNILKNEYNAYVIEADSLAHKLMEPGMEGYEAIVKAFGEEILQGPGQAIDRSKLGAVVFADKDKLETLNGLIHPIVKNNILKQIDEAKEKDESLFIIEAALLIQDGYKAICDELWYIRCDLDVRVNRLIEFRGFTKDRACSVIANQPDEEYFTKGCDVVIDNSKDITYLKTQLYSKLH